MAGTIGVTYKNSFDDSAQSRWGSTGLQLSTGHNDGKHKAFIGQLNAEVLYTDKKSMNVGLNGYAGAEYPIIRQGCHNWFTNLGIGAAVEGACEFEPVTRDQNHAGSIYGGGRVQVAWRGPYHEISAGFRGGYKQSGSVYIDADAKKANINKESSQGHPVYGPCVSLLGCIPGTQYRTDVKGGLWVKGEGSYNIADKTPEVKVSIGYTF